MAKQTMQIWCTQTNPTTQYKKTSEQIWTKIYENIDVHDSYFLWNFGKILSNHFHI